MIIKLQFDMLYSTVAKRTDSGFKSWLSYLPGQSNSPLCAPVPSSVKPIS